MCKLFLFSPMTDSLSKICIILVMWTIRFSATFCIVLYNFVSKCSLFETLDLSVNSLYVSHVYISVFRCLIYIICLSSLLKLISAQNFCLPSVKRFVTESDGLSLLTSNRSLFISMI